jgi:hypothetical protein
VSVLKNGRGILGTKMMRGSISNMSSCSRHMYASFFRLWFVNGGEGLEKQEKGVVNLRMWISRKKEGLVP